MSDEFVALKLNGLAGVTAQIEELKAEIALKNLVASCRRAFNPVLIVAKALCAVDSGALRDSLRITAIKPESGGLVAVVGIYVAKSARGKPGELAPARRWHFIELGTATLPAHPFLRPALDENAQTVVDIFSKDLNARFAKAIAKQRRSS